MHGGKERTVVNEERGKRIIKRGKVEPLVVSFYSCVYSCVLQ